MNKPKFFDRYQLLIVIIGVACFINYIIVFSIAFMTAKATYKEPGVVDTVIYNPILQGIYSFFFFAHLLAILWFIIRAATFNMRIKEMDLL